MKYKNIIVAYKNPKLRKLKYIEFVTMEEALKAPKEIKHNKRIYLQYGIC